LRVNGGALQAIVDDNDGGDQSGLVTGTTLVDDGEWHHVAFVRDAGSDLVKLFLDYELEAVASDDTVNTSFNTNDIRIGEFKNAGAQFIGDIDAVRISGGVLPTYQFLGVMAPPVPEPASALLLLAASGSLLRRRRA